MINKYTQFRDVANLCFCSSILRKILITTNLFIQEYLQQSQKLSDCNYVILHLNCLKILYTIV